MAAKTRNVSQDGLRIAREYGPRRPALRRGARLMPFAAYRTGSGATLVSDPMNGRVLLVGHGGEVLAEVRCPSSSRWFPRWAFPLEEGGFVFADRNARTVGLVGPDGEIAKTVAVDLDVPLFVCPDPDGGFLVAGRGRNALLHLDDALEEQVILLDGSFSLQSAQPLDDGRILVCLDFDS